MQQRYLFVLSVLSLTFCDHFHPCTKLEDNVALLLTNTIISSLIYQRKITERDCLLSLIFPTSNATFKTLSTVQLDTMSKALETPYKLFYYSIDNLSITQFYSPPQPKHQSNCWTTVITLQTQSDSALVTQNKMQLGNPIYDQFIFLSQSGSVLCTVLENSKIVNKFVNKYGMYPENDKVIYLSDPLFYTGSLVETTRLQIHDKVKNLNGQIVSIVYKDYPPYIILKNGSEDVDGLQIYFLKEISKRTNSTFVFVPKFIAAFGNFENGSWTGMIGELVEGRADIAALMIPNTQRYPYVSFSNPTYNEILTFSLMTPPVKRHWQALIRPLTPRLWLLTFATYFAFVTTLLMQKIIRGRRVQLELLLEAILKLYTILMDQVCKISKKETCRFIMFFWIFFCYFIGVAFKSNLVTHLTFLEKKAIPTTLNQLSEATQFDVILQSIGGMEVDLIRKSHTPEMQKIARRMSLKASVLTCLEASANSMTACVGWSSTIASGIAKYSASNPNFKSLVVPKQADTQLHGSVAYKKDLIFQQEINRYIGAARGGHLTDKWYKDYIIKMERDAADEVMEGDSGNKEYSHENIKTGEHPLTNSNLYIVFVLVTVGSLFSWICFCLELLVNYYKNCTRKQEWDYYNSGYEGNVFLLQAQHFPIRMLEYFMKQR
ncbi:unnamed protein product [Orchesella dallaii]|uniref:Ionotropic glutamate receptor L-glutamate and glycine-binding domain-containing protein n=1 Tax=Orchesella dallaii TaxID=48710 RepID=A0ABP1R8T0_9HEXA